MLEQNVEFLKGYNIFSKQQCIAVLWGNNNFLGHSSSSNKSCVVNSQENCFSCMSLNNKEKAL